MNSTMSRNGQARKSLAEQIDRLDTLLDGLASGLNESVAAVVQEAVGLAVQEAVRAVLTEVLQNPALRAQLQQPAPATAPEARPPARGSWLRASGQLVAQATQAFRTVVAIALQAAVQTVRARLDWFAQGSQRVGTAVGQRCGRWVVGCQQLCRLAGSFPGPLVTAVLVGVVTGVAVYHASPWLSAVAGGLGGFALSGVLHLGLRLRSLLPLLTGESLQ